MKGMATKTGSTGGAAAASEKESKMAKVKSLFRSSKSKTKEKTVLSIGPFELGATLGIGGYARVMLGVHQETKEKVALKLLLADEKGVISESKKRQTDRAIELLSKVKHANVLKLVSFDKEATFPDGTSCMMMALEHAPNGELFDYLMFTGCFSEEVSRSYFHQLLDGLQAIHGQGYAHRDLKPENLLLDKDYRLKIADFGFATSFVREDDPSSIVKMATACGTKGYLAPEVLRGEKYVQSVDLFAAGIILFIMYAGFPPFNDAVATDWWWARLEAGWKERALRTGKVVDKKGDWSKHGLFWAAHERTRTFPVDLKDFLLKLMHYDPKQRPTIAQIRTEKWSYYQTPPRVYGKKESKQKKADVAYIKAHTDRFVDPSGKTVVDGRSWFNGEVLTQEELAAYLEERRATVRKESAKKVAEQQRELDALPKRPDVPTDALAELDRTPLEFLLATGMKKHAEEIDPEGLFNEYVQDFNEDLLFSSTPYFFYTRMLPDITMATFDFVAKALYDKAEVSFSYEATQTLIETVYQPEPVLLETGAAAGDDEKTDAAATPAEEMPVFPAMPCKFAVTTYRVEAEDELYIVSCKRVGGDPMAFKGMIKKLWGHDQVASLMHLLDSEILVAEEASTDAVKSAAAVTAETTEDAAAVEAPEEAAAE